MPTSIKALYDSGKIIPLEEPPLKDTPVEVTVIFPDANNGAAVNKRTNEIIFGSLKGKLSVPDDFDEPLDDLKDYMQDEVVD